MSWPPNLTELKDEMKAPAGASTDDDRLQRVLDAAVRVVERLREGDLNFGLTADADLPDPDADVVLGTMRLAWRWHTRRKSPDALVSMAELGTGRVPMFDNDIEMLLQVGRHRVPVISGGEADYLTSTQRRRPFDWFY